MHTVTYERSPATTQPVQEKRLCNSATYWAHSHRRSLVHGPVSKPKLDGEHPVASIVQAVPHGQRHKRIPCELPSDCLGELQRYDSAGNDVDTAERFPLALMHPEYQSMASNLPDSRVTLERRASRDSLREQPKTYLVSVGCDGERRCQTSCEYHKYASSVLLVSSHGLGRRQALGSAPSTGRIRRKPSLRESRSALDRLGCECRVSSSSAGHALPRF